MSVGRGSRSIAWLAPLAICVPATALADDVTTGSLRGVVTDKAAGTPALAAVVSATSPALQGAQSAIVDDAGAYYLTSLPPGAYTLTVSYNGAVFPRGNIVVQVGKQAVVNIAVDGRAAPGEVITIVGSAPLIDQGSTKIGQSFTADYTNNIPNPGTFGGTIAATGGAQLDAHGVSFAGATSPENVYIIEGLNTTDTGFGTLAADLPNEFLQETEVITGGYAAEYGRATGALINVVTRSGGNELHGSVFGRWAPGAFAAAARTIRREGTAIDAAVDQDDRYDLGAELGGAIVRDKLWFHVGFSPSIAHSTTTRIVNHYFDDDQDGVPDQEGGFTRRAEVARRDIPASSKTYYLTAKLTGAVSDHHRWSLAGWGNPRQAEQVFDTVRDPSSAVEHVDSGSYDASAQWTSKLADGATQVDVVLGYHHGYANTRPRGGADVPQVRYDYTRSLYDFADLEGDIAACRDGGANDPYPKIVNCPVLSYTDRGVGFVEDRTNDRMSARVALTQRFELLGRHVVKLGGDVERSTYNSGRRFTGGALILGTGDHVYNITQYLQYEPGGAIPCGIDANGDGIGDIQCSLIPKLAANTGDRSIALFLQDSWQPIPQLTFNLGLRWEQQVGYEAGFLQGTVDPATGAVVPDKGFQLDDLLAPRLGFIFDPTNEGRAKLMGHWGRFYENIPMDLNIRSFAAETLTQSLAGLQPNGAPDPACQLDHDTPDLASRLLACSQTQQQVLGGGLSFVAPGLQGQYTQELILGAELEIMPQLSVAASYIHRTLPRVIEDMSTDGGNTFLIANPGADYDRDAARLDAQAAQMSDPQLQALYHARAAQLRAVKTFDPPHRRYDALTLSARTRPTPQGLLVATYTYSRSVGNYPGLFSTETALLDPNVSTQYDLPDLMPNRYGPLGLDRPHNLKVDGFYQLAVAKLGVVTLGASLHAQSGTPANALAAHPVYGQGESYLVPRGLLYRSPVDVTVDTHLGYGYPLSKTVRLEAFIDIFNLFNAQPEIAVDQTYTTDPALPIVGGDADDLAHAKSSANGRQLPTTVTRNLNYGKTSLRQAPLTGQVGFRLTF